MSEKKIIIGIVMLTMLFLAGGIVLFSGGNSTPVTLTYSQNAKASIDKLSYDWGRIDMKNGNVSNNFIIKNTGKETLKLTKIKTSCHCTRANVKIGNTTSPYFGMNTSSPWVGEVPPGQEARLQVIFDPAYHGPQGVGPVNRLVSVETNDKSNSRIEFSLKGVVFRE